METLEKLDRYLNERLSTPSEKVLAALMVGALFFFASKPLIPLAESEAQFQKTRKAGLEKRLAGEKQYLKSITVNGDRTFYIKKYKREIEKGRLLLSDYQEKVRKLKKLSSVLSPLLFNKKNWADFLDGITGKADDRGLKVLSVDNHFSEQNGSVENFSETVSVSGDYRGMVGLIKDLEEQSMITTVDYIKIFADENGTVMDMNVSVWGVKL